MLPNDVFKRPGPHHAYEVDLARRARICEALDPLEQYGIPEPLAECLGVEVETVLEGAFLFYDLPIHCTVGEDFGLSDYGPMFVQMDLPVVVGEALFPERDARVDPVSWWWAEHRPPLAGTLVAPAAALLDQSAVLVSPPSEAWARLREEADDREGPESERDPDPERRPDALIASWQRAYPAEVEAYRTHLAELAARDAWVTTWMSDEGWL